MGITEEIPKGFGLVKIRGIDSSSQYVSRLQVYYIIKKLNI